MTTDAAVKRLLRFGFTMSSMVDHRHRTDPTALPLIAEIDGGPRVAHRPWDRLFERAPAAPPTDGTTSRAVPFVAMVVLVSIGCFAVATVLTATEVRRPHIVAATLLGVVAIAAEILNHKHFKGSTGSIAVIPFTAAILLAPNFAGILASALAGVIAQAVRRRQIVKAAFNVAQIVLGASLGVLVFRVLGGETLLASDGSSLLQTTRTAFIPAIAVTATMLTANAAAISGVVALTQGKSYWVALRANLQSSVPLFALTSFVTFYFSWLYAQLGAVGAAGLALPLLGIRQLYRTTIELTRVTEELLDLMVATVEARDPYTSGHSQRVATASRIIARSIGLREVDVERAGVAALLHDVGKIDERFAPILAKEGRLTPEEWDLMKQHPIRSAELVGLLSGLRDVIPPVRHHHENWDGTGYPDGLRGDNIPLAARIIMFADTLDAMTSDRPYRKALSMEEARAELVKFRGRQFDPAICDRIIQAETWTKLYDSFAKPKEQPRHSRAS